ncbi:MAG: hypothetical protein SPI30_10215 [Prevotella sp.]|nr:hypothetical protein [Prevotella sp.]
MWLPMTGTNRASHWYDDNTCLYRFLSTPRGEEELCASANTQGCVINETDACSST